MRSIWQETAKRPELFPLSHIKPLAQTDAEAIVIGGGLAGVLTAFLLQEKGIRTIVLEAVKVGGGQTGFTTAKVTAQHGLIYEKLLRQVGRERAEQYAHANQSAIGAYYDLISQYQIDCDWKFLPAYLYSVQDPEILKREAEAARILGFQVSQQTDTALPFPVAGMIGFEKQAQFNPLKFLYHLAERLPVYEHARVWKAEGNHVEVIHCGKRLKLKARYIIFATHYPFLNRPGYYFARMHQERSYVVAVEGAADLQGMYLGVDRHSMSFRNDGGLLLVGGGKHRTGENKNGGQYEMLRHKAGCWWPDCRERTRWSAQDCMSLDQIPYIGTYSKRNLDWYVATGFKKWGMTTSMAAARLITDAILSNPNPDGEVFSPQRRNWQAAAGSFVKNGAAAVKNLTRQVCSIPKETLDQLPDDHGGIVKHEGKKVGVYKDKNGIVYAVSTKCPHLGCQLSWNPEEKSWDCPCHGSRFDYRGRLLNNPAQRTITCDNGNKK